VRKNEGTEGKKKKGRCSRLRSPPAFPLLLLFSYPRFSGKHAVREEGIAILLALLLVFPLLLLLLLWRKRRQERRRRRRRSKASSSGRECNKPFRVFRFFLCVVSACSPVSL